MMGTSINQLQEYVSSLNEADARSLYRLLGAKISLLNKARDLVSLQKFNVLDRVAFHDKGRHIEGVITRINIRTVSIITTDGHNWTVPPSLLTKLDVPLVVKSKSKVSTSQSSSNKKRRPIFRTKPPKKPF